MGVRVDGGVSTACEPLYAPVLTPLRRIPFGIQRARQLKKMFTLNFRSKNFLQYLSRFV